MTFKVRSDKYIGVYRHGDWWRPYIKLNVGIKWLGLFDDEELAAKVRDCALRVWKRSPRLYQFKDDQLTSDVWSRFRYEISRSIEGTRGPDRKKRKRRRENVI